MAFYAIWQRFSVMDTTPAGVCLASLRYHSNALVERKRHTALSNFCQAIFHDAEQDFVKAHASIQTLLNSLQEVCVAAPAFANIMVHGPCIV